MTTDTGTRQVQYKVRWLGYCATDDTWMPLSQLENAQGKVRAFQAVFPGEGDVEGDAEGEGEGDSDSDGHG